MRTITPEQHAQHMATPGKDLYLWALTEVCGISRRQLARDLGVPLRAVQEPVPHYAQALMRSLLREISVALEDLRSYDPVMQSYNTSRRQLIDRINGDARTTRGKIGRFKLGPTTAKQETTSRDDPV